MLLYKVGVMSNCIHCIITRFSYRFCKTDPIDKLLSDERLEHRLKIFTKYCWPSIINQRCNNFYWIIIIDPLLPNKYKLYLIDLINSFYRSSDYNKYGPRKIILHMWDWDNNKLERIDWILDYFDKATIPKYLITTRLDDDDALSKIFVKQIQSHLTNRKEIISDFLYLSYCLGYYYYSNSHSLKVTKSPMIALGLSLITHIKKWPMCVYLGNHTRIPTYLRNPQNHKYFSELCIKNKQPLTKSDMGKTRLKVIKNGVKPMWVRTIHGYNLQRNLKKLYENQKTREADNRIKSILSDLFNVNLNINININANINFDKTNSTTTQTNTTQTNTTQANTTQTNTTQTISLK